MIATIYKAMGWKAVVYSMEGPEATSMGFNTPEEAYEMAKLFAEEFGCDLSVVESFPTCEKHSEKYPEGSVCPACQTEIVRAKFAEMKARRAEKLLMKH